VVKVSKQDVGDSTDPRVHKVSRKAWLQTLFQSPFTKRMLFLVYSAAFVESRSWSAFFFFFADVFRCVEECRAVVARCSYCTVLMQTTALPYSSEFDRVD
jgi:hypothetical protein